MKYLSNQINWQEVKAIGFDLDGTIYDEFDFIKSAYTAIVESFNFETCQKLPMLDFMLGRWLEKGSSYPYIFDECLHFFQVPDSEREDIIQKSLQLFREHKPELQLSNRIFQLLMDAKNTYELFLLSDGREKLQMEKFHALKLDRFFATEDIHISGKYGKGYEKPKTLVLEKIRSLQTGIPATATLYIGDRKRDELFAQNAGFQFCYIQELFNKID
jgi:putative hydrolase of the HAD superfamily